MLGEIYFSAKKKYKKIFFCFGNKNIIEKFEKISSLLFYSEFYRRKNSKLSVNRSSLQTLIKDKGVKKILVSYYLK